MYYFEKYIKSLNKFIIILFIISLLIIVTNIIITFSNTFISKSFEVINDFAITIIMTLIFYFTFEHKKNIDNKLFAIKYIKQYGNNLIHNNCVFFLNLFSYNGTDKRFENYYPNENELRDFLVGFKWSDYAPIILTPDNRKGNYMELLNDNIQRTKKLIEDVKNHSFSIYQDLELLEIVIKIENANLITHFYIFKFDADNSDVNNILITFLKQYIDILYEFKSYLEKHNLLINK